MDKNNPNREITKFYQQGKYSYSLIGLITLFCGLSGQLSAQFFYNETCRNATGAFQYYMDAPGYTAGLSIDNVGEGWLRLTENSIYQRGYVLLDKTFPSTMGVSIEFDSKVWSDEFPASFPVPGDGFCVFLFDGDPAKTFTIGYAGGSLGYRGLSPAYLGIGISEYGTFSDPSYIINAPERRPHSIAIANAKYYYVAGTKSQLGNNTDLAYTTPVSVRPTDTTFYRRIKIDIEPVSGGMSINVYIKTSPTENFNLVLGPVTVTQPTPPLLRLGFSGVTGLALAFHEVRDVIVRTPGELSVFKSTNDCPSLNNVVINTIITNNINTVTSGITVLDTLPANFTFTGSVPTVTGGTMSNFTHFSTEGDGREVYTYTIDAPANSVVNIAYNGGFTVTPSNEEFTSSVGITPPTGFNDNNLNDNHATITNNILPTATADMIDVSGATEICSEMNTTTLTANAQNISNPEYKWYLSQMETTPFNIGGSYTISNLTKDTTLYISVSGNDYCENAVGDRKAVTVRIYPTPSYPDIRVRVCPDAGTVNLAKYIDTTDNITDIQWAHQIPSIAISGKAGIISTAVLAHSRIHTLTYTIASRCVSEQKRKVYLEVLKNGRVRPPKDTIVMCYKNAEAVNINQLIGIEAGGEWEYYSSNSHDVDNYVKQSTSPVYGGAVVMNGKAIYEDEDISETIYHGVTAKTVKFVYKTADNSCLSGKSYSVVIVLAEL